MLSAFLDDNRLMDIFGKNMLQDREFKDMFNGLVYQDFDKPFECVGTRAEIKLALYTAAEKRNGRELPLLLKEYIDSNKEKPSSLDDYFDNNNFVPKEFIGLLQREGTL